MTYGPRHVRRARGLITATSSFGTNVRREGRRVGMMRCITKLPTTMAAAANASNVSHEIDTTAIKQASKQARDVILLCGLILD